MPQADWLPIAYEALKLDGGDKNGRVKILHPAV